MRIAQNIYQSGTLYRQHEFHGFGCASAVNAKVPPGGIPEDRVTLSKAALEGNKEKPAVDKAIKSQETLSDEQRQVVNDLKKRDVEVKAHERAHMAAGGPVVQGGATYQYQTGPDGKMYAVGGEVKIDVSPERTPEATIRKMQQIRRAALAPAQPSSTDRAVAAQAAQAEAQARVEKNEQSKSEDPHNTIQSQDPPAKADASATDPLSMAANGRHIDLVA